jgi:hypothetical protein
MTDSTQDVLIVMLIIFAVLDVIQHRLSQKIKKMEADLKEREE